MTGFCAFFSTWNSGHFLQILVVRTWRKRKKSHWTKIQKSHWRGLPEITDFCPLSWSNAVQSYWAWKAGNFTQNLSANPKPHPSKPHPCNRPQAKTEVALQFSESCAAEVALQHSLFSSADIIFTKSCAATNENCIATLRKLHCKKVALSCRFPADSKLLRLGTHV